MNRHGYLRQIQKVHRQFVLKRREVVLASQLCQILPANVHHALDVGCGDGIISRYAMEQTPDLNIEGIEVHARPECQIKYTLFDGSHLPFNNASFDAVFLVDVLHHVDDIENMFEECLRVSRQYIFIKDHLWMNQFDILLLRFMDWVGNRAHGVRLVYNYKQREFWRDLFGKKNLKTLEWKERIGLYPFPFRALFERDKHFIALISK